jgi:hypothetical protein
MSWQEPSSAGPSSSVSRRSYHTDGEIIKELCFIVKELRMAEADEKTSQHSGGSLGGSGGDALVSQIAGDRQGARSVRDWQGVTDTVRWQGTAKGRGG